MCVCAWGSHQSVALMQMLTYTTLAAAAHFTFNLNVFVYLQHFAEMYLINEIISKRVVFWMEI